MPRRNVWLIRVGAAALAAAPLAPLAALGDPAVALATGRYDEAARAARERLAADPADAAARLTAARAALAVGRREEALAVLAPAAQGEDDAGRDPAARLAAARVRLLYADLTGDAALAKRVLERDLLEIESVLPDSAVPHALRVAAFLAAGQRHDAREEARRGLAKNPNDPELLLALGRPEDVVARDPDHAEARVACALKILFGAQAFAVAPEPPEDPGGYRPEVGPRVPDERDRRAALAHLEKALAANPRSAAAHAALAAWRYFDGDVEGFRAAAAAARRINPSCALPEFWAARLSEDPRDPREAIRWERQAVAIDPFLTEAWLSLGRHCMNEGYEDEAREAFRRACSLAPFNVIAKNILTLLEDLPAHFVVRRTPRFEIRLSRREDPVVGPLAESLLEAWYAELAKRYRFEPETPVKVDLYDDMQDFAVRGFGVPGAPFLGVCLGRVVVSQSATPLAAQDRSWAQILRHELMHVFSIQMTEGRVAQWFTEGLSTYEERRFHPSWDWEEGIEEQIIDALHDGSLLPLSRLSEGFRDKERVRMYYYVSSLACEYIDGRFGTEGLVRMMAAWRKGSGARTPAQEMMRAWTGARDADVVREALGVTLAELEAGFRAWLSERAAAVAVRPRVPPEALDRLRAAAAAAPEDAAAAAQLARACFQNGLLDEARRAAEGVVARRAAWEDGPDAARAADVYVVLGHLAHDRGDAAAARDAFREAERLGSRDFYLFYALGRLAEEDEAFAEARAWYERAVVCFPRRVEGGFDPYRRLYAVAKALGDAEGMVSAVARRAAVAHEDARARRWLMGRHRAAGRHREVIETGTELLWIDPLDPRTHAAMAEAHLALAETEKASRAAALALAALPFLDAYAAEDGAGREALADVYCAAATAAAAAGRRDEARVLARKAVDAFPRSREALALLENLDGASDETAPGALPTR